MNKPRIRVRVTDNNCNVIFNGKAWAVIHKNDLKNGLIEHVQYLRSIKCDWSADQILKCVRVN
jgi:hypothetical protein